MQPFMNKCRLVTKVHLKELALLWIIDNCTSFGLTSLEVNDLF